jgi:hypothetical protein
MPSLSRLHETTVADTVADFPDLEKAAHVRLERAYQKSERDKMPFRERVRFIFLH